MPMQPKIQGSSLCNCSNDSGVLLHEAVIGNLGLKYIIKNATEMAS